MPKFLQTPLNQAVVVALVTGWAVNYFKPDFVYINGMLKDERINPVTVGVVAGIIVLLFHWGQGNIKLPGRGNNLGAEFAPVKAESLGADTFFE